MKRRKVIQLGKDTSVITLPTAWVRKNGVKKGDELIVEESDNSLRVSPSKIKKKEGVILLDYSSLGKFYIWRFVHAAYIKGYDEIKIRFKTKKELENIESIPRWFIGFAIVKQGKQEVVLRAVSEQTKEEFQTMLLRCHNMIKDMINDSIKGAGAKELKKRDYMLNSFIEYCLRYIEKYREFFELVPLLNSLERIGDSVCTLDKDKKRFAKIFDLLYSLHYGARDAKKLRIVKKEIDLISDSSKEILIDLLENIITIKIKEYEQK